MSRRFNPPPNWPQPPKNWAPGADWQPDPAWGPAPRGWQLWIDSFEGLTEAQPPAPRERHIFISYRRTDCQPQANAINDGLRHRLTSARVFMDIDSIPIGVDFEKHVREEIEVCDVVLVLIGDDWLSATDRDGNRRIDNPDDFVRLEIQSALSSPRVSLVPVLVEGAEMPRQSELPEPIRDLARINAIVLSDQRWSSDIERLAKVIHDLEVHQEAKALRRPEAPASSNGPILASEPVTPTMRLGDVNSAVVKSVVMQLPDAFYTRDVSEHPLMREAHGAIAEASNYHSIIGRHLEAHHPELGLGPAEAATGNRGSIWRRSRSAPAAPAWPPAQVPGSAASWQPQPPVAQRAGRSPSGGIGVVMVAIPLLSCGFLSFVPSIWVAYRRRSSPSLMTRALITSGVFFVVMVVATIMFSTAPTDADGTPVGAASNIGLAALFIGGVVAAILALFQRDPEDALS